MADSVQCAGCGNELPKEYEAIPRKPCPHCGALARNLFASASVGIVVSSSVTATQRFGHTGREVLGADAERRAIEWAALTNRDAMLKHSAAEDFRDLIASAPCLTSDVLILFRGQGIRDTEPVPPLIARMGPLPLDRTPGEGRYHRAGERVLYLADSTDGVRREMEAWLTQGTPYVIRVEVPLTSLRIVDFSNWPSDHLITAVCSRAEMCNVPNRGPANYVFSQVVGELVAERFDGMKIPGVRGAPGAHYRNVVLFRGLTEWAKWTSPSSPPGLLFPPSASDPPEECIAVAAYYLWEKDGSVDGRDKVHWFQAKSDLIGK
jgi:Protein of unknown function (DUF2934)/RES domain